MRRQVVVTLAGNGWQLNVVSADGYDVVLADLDNAQHGEHALTVSGFDGKRTRVGSDALRFVIAVWEQDVDDAPVHLKRVAVPRGARLREDT